MANKVVYSKYKLGVSHHIKINITLQACIDKKFLKFQNLTPSNLILESSQLDFVGNHLKAS